MKIQGKLNLATYTILAGFAAALGVIFYMNHVGDTLKDLELQSVKVVKSMYELTDSTKAMILSNTVDLKELESSWDVTIKSLGGALTVLRDHKANAYLDPALAEEIGRTEAVWSINMKQFEKVKEGIQSIIGSSLIHVNQRKGLRYITETLKNEGKTEGNLFFNLLTTQSNLETLDQAGKEFIVKNLSVLGDAIRQKAEDAGRFGRIVSIGIGAAILLLASIFVAIFSRSLAKRIGKIEDTMRQVSQKDLSVRTMVKAKDEIGALSIHINSTLDILAGFFNEVREAVRKMDALKDNLSASSTESASALNEITKNIESIRDQFMVLDKNIAMTTDTVDTIVREVQELTNQIDDQSRSINDSSSAIEEMAASIDSVAKLSTERKNRATGLLRVIREGGDKVAVTNDVIKSISKEIDAILEIIEIINNVSEQTNLLSMNAAIESAHAGEAGKGFAVVAEEIRKLAESTSENSSRIDSSLKSITEKIKEALESSNSSSKNFDDINTEVKDFADALEEIATNMDELAAGGSEILKSSGKISEITRRIQQAAQAMNSGTKNIYKAAVDSRNISAEVVGGMNEIEKGSKEILTSIVEMTKITETTRERMEILHEKVETFIIDEQKEEGAAEEDSEGSLEPITTAE